MKRKWRIKSYVSANTGRRIWVVHSPEYPLRSFVGVPHISWITALDYVNGQIKQEAEAKAAFELAKDIYRRGIITQDNAWSLLRNITIT